MLPFIVGKSEKITFKSMSIWKYDGFLLEYFIDPPIVRSTNKIKTVFLTQTCNTIGFVTWFLSKEVGHLITIFSSVTLSPHVAITPVLYCQICQMTHNQLIKYCRNYMVNVFTKQALLFHLMIVNWTNEKLYNDYYNT